MCGPLTNGVIAGVKIVIINIGLARGLWKVDDGPNFIIIEDPIARFIFFFGIVMRKTSNVIKMGMSAWKTPV